MQTKNTNGLPLEDNPKHKGFSGKLGFVLAAAGSAVGLGNMWRFPYLAAQYGGGIFLLCYVILAVLFGVILLRLEISIGRSTGKGAIGAFGTLNKKFKWLGILCVIVPAIIVCYYCLIGGNVLKYLFSYTIGDSNLVGSNVNTESFYVGYSSSTFEPIIFLLIFALANIVVILGGVKKGIENMSKILMPALAVISIALMIFVVCQDGAGQGLAYLFIPKFEDFSFKTVLAALGQLFYSMSIAMGIMVTYGSYMKKSVSIKSSSTQIAVCDSLFAIVSAMIIIPAVFAFSPNPEAVLSQKGGSLMFLQLTQIFNNIPAGRLIGAIFFLLVFFAALTSSISLIEAIVAVLCENLKFKRWVACLSVFGLILVFGTLCSLGNGVLSFIQIGGLGILDMMDYLSNNLMMPIIAICICIFAGFFIDKKILPKEIGIDKSRFQTTYFNIVVKYVAPIAILLILVTSFFVTI